MPQDESAEERVKKTISAIHRAILDASPEAEGSRVVNMEEALTAMAYLIAAIGLQTKAAENRTAIKAFVRQTAGRIELGIKMLRDSGDPKPFARGMAHIAHGSGSQH
jgi:hypothetical protein